MFWKILSWACVAIMLLAGVAGYLTGMDESHSSNPAAVAAQPNNGNMPKFNF